MPALDAFTQPTDSPDDNVHPWRKHWETQPRIDDKKRAQPVCQALQSPSLVMRLAVAVLGTCLSQIYRMTMPCKWQSGVVSVASDDRSDRPDRWASTRADSSRGITASITLSSCRNDIWLLLFFCIHGSVLNFLLMML